MEKLGFFTPVIFDDPKSVKKQLLENVDGFFTLGNERAFVVSSLSERNVEKVEIKELYQSSFSKFIIGILKIASYMTIVIPLLMLAAKATLRAQHDFEVTENVSQKNIYCFGDIHGELDGFLSNIRQAGFIDDNNNWMRRDGATLVQLGDVVDRGPKSREAWRFLARLQRQAGHGKVVRLLGNHELMLLEGDNRFANYERPEQLAQEIRQEILSGRVKLAYCDDKRLFVHAGLRSKIRNLLISEIKRTRGGFLGWRNILGSQEVTLQDICDHLNHLLIDAARRNDYSHPIFQVGRARGGFASVGGVLWEDVSEMLNSRRARDVPQVIAHNPPRRAGDAPIRVHDSMKLINVDAGLCEAYGGKQAFVHLRDRDVVIYDKKRSCWNPFARNWSRRIIRDRVRA